MRYLTISLLVLAMTLPAFGKKKAAPPMTSGAPGDRTCLTSKCHAGSDLNGGDAEITISGLPEAYTPNEIYEITLALQQKGAKKWGFIATAADSAGNALGTLDADKKSKTQVLSNAKYKSRTDRQYVSHTQKSITGPKKGKSPEWKLTWQAPTEASSPGTFYFAFNAANGNGKKTGDQIYTREIMIPAKTD